MLAAGVVLFAVLPAPAAPAESTAQAQARAAAAARRVDALAARVERALRAYDRAMADLAAGTSRSLSAAQAADLAEALTQADRRALQRRVRVLYMSGGPAALVAGVLAAGSASEALRQAGYVQRLVRAGTADAEASADDAAALQARATALQQAAASGTTTAAEVERRYGQLTAALAAATAERDRLDTRARARQRARQAAARLAQLASAVDATEQQWVATARASADVPPAYRRLYNAAARTCPDMSWTLLAAIGQVESGHGANTSTSYAGAQGPMQFLPSTFAAYAVDGDRDGDADINDPADAVFTAARYLCANGAGRTPAATARAVWRYNQADWYVALVLELARQYAAQPRP